MDPLLRPQPDADMRREAEMCHQHQGAVSSLHKSARSVLHLAPTAALLMVRKLLQHPAAREAVRHSQARQLAAEQLALNVASSSCGELAWLLDYPLL
jgi:hypothetical protein